MGQIIISVGAAILLACLGIALLIGAYAFLKYGKENFSEI